MIPAIGYAVAFYIIARSVSFLTRKGERAESIIAKVFYIIALVVAVICIVILITGELNYQPSSLIQSHSGW
jgi:predicted PurR-regulated permease PerM